MKFDNTLKFSEVNPYRFFQRDQSWFSQVEVRHNHTRKVLRVTIRRNAYDAQSYKKVEIFDLSVGRWNTVSDLPLVPNDACYGISYVKQSLGNPEKVLFSRDTEAMLEVVAEILRSAS